MVVQFFFESILSPAGPFEFFGHVQIQVGAYGGCRDLSKALLYRFGYCCYRGSIMLGQIANYRVSDAAWCTRHQTTPAKVRYSERRPDVKLACGSRRTSLFSFCSNVN